MLKNSAIILAVLFFLFAKESFSESFKYLTSVNGLSHNTVLDITQDQEGFIWFATRDGLNRYDGYNIVQYYNSNDSNSLPSNSVGSLLLTSSNKLLVGTQDGLCVYHKEQNNFKRIEFGNTPSIFSMTELSDGSFILLAPVNMFSMDTLYNVKRLVGESYVDVCEYKEGILLGAKRNNELHLMNSKGVILRKYKINSTEKYIELECLFTDSEGILWLGTSNDGLYVFDSDGDRFVRVKMNNNTNTINEKFVRCIAEDVDARIWIGTESGIYIYDKRNKTFVNHSKGFYEKFGKLNDNAVYTISPSRENIMWAGTYFGGINYCMLNNNGFNNVYADGGLSYLSGNALSDIIEYDSKTLWIATEDGGINVYNKEKNTFSYINNKTKVGKGLLSDNIHALAKDKRGNVYIGTFRGGLHLYTKQLNTIKPVKLNYPIGILEQSIYGLHIDEDEQVWVCAVSGLYLKAKNKKQFEIYLPAVFKERHLYDITSDKNKNKWVCTRFMGIVKIDSLDNVTRFNKNNTPNIISDNIVDVEQRTDGSLWFGTIEGGLIRHIPDKGSFKTYTIEDGLPNNTIYKITEDKNGMLWLTTNRGISMFNPKTEQFKNYSERDGIIGNQFNYKSGCLASDGTLFLGAVNGLTMFNPLELNSDSTPLQVHLTGLNILNNNIPIDPNGLLKKHINFADEIELKYSHKVFTISYLAINMLAPGKNNYAYYLEGFENSWNYVGNKTEATYTNLSPGDYLFHLKAANNNGEWPVQEKTLRIYVKPPIWLSAWGFLFYGLIIIGIIILFRTYSINKHKERLDVKLAKFERNKIEELNQNRLSFFTYISHEFKTPLTLIISTLDHFLKFEDVLPKYKSYGNLIKKNATRLLFLINQLMDFRTIESDHASIKLVRSNVLGFFKNTFDAFEYLFESKNISARFTCDKSDYMAYFDADKLEKITTNLLSNAYKNTPANGTIVFDVKIVENNFTALPNDNMNRSADVVFSISDSGEGMSSEKVKQIFEPFFTEAHEEVLGTGIGLALVQSLVKLLNGEINVSSSPKKGSTFSVSLPLIFNPSHDVEIQKDFVQKNERLKLEDTVFDNQDIVFEEEHASQLSHKEYLMLIVEDNKELSAFLAQHYSQIFRIKLASNGEEALSVLNKHQPDILLSDIMMPKLDGIELCKRLKSDIKTSHIPIILLTAKSGDEVRIKSLEYGADAYIAKPFNLKELDFSIKNLLKAREDLRNQFSSLRNMDESIEGLNNTDQNFVNKLTEIVYENLDNADFDVEFFTQKVGISRTLLYMKLKKITGKSATEFIRMIRLSEAEKLLKTTDFTISEIAYKVGFNDPTYFSRMYKSMYNKTPSAVRNKNN